MIKTIMAAISMGVLILDAGTALAGARSGIDICLYTVIPSLFPLFILSSIIVAAPRTASMRILKPIGKLCKLPSGTHTLFLTGLLGGYPVGAKIVTQSYINGCINKEEADRMIVICNQCGPAFLFGMIGQTLESSRICWVLWSIQIVSILLTARMLPIIKCLEHRRSRTEFDKAGDVMASSVKTMGIVCAWIILFRVVIQYFDKWVLRYCSEPTQTLIYGFLEISNGCIETKKIADPFARFLLSAFMINFGGLCVTLQTFSVISQESDKRRYLLGKVLQTGIAVSISCVIGSVMYKRPLPYITMLLTTLIISMIIFQLRDPKNSSIPEAIVV